MFNLLLCDWSSQLFDLRASSSTDVPVLLLSQPNRDFKIGDYGRLGRLDRCHVTQNTRDLLPSSFWDGMFSPGFSS